MTTSSLRNQSCKELSQMARAVGLPGWHSMRKDELVRALMNHARRKPKQSDIGTSVLSRAEGRTNGTRTGSAANERLRQLRTRLAEIRQIGSANGNESRRPEQDRLVVMVRDPYWLHAYWELAPQSV